MEKKDALYRYLLSRVGQPDVVEELWQEVHARVKSAPEDRLIENPQGYLFTIARNLLRERGIEGRDIDDPATQEGKAFLPPRDGTVKPGGTQKKDGLYRYLLSRVRRPDVAEDLWQEAQARMLRVPKDRLIENPEGYLFTIARNLLRERGLEGRRQQLERDVDDPAIQDEISEAPEYGEEIDRQVYKERLHRALRELPPKCQAAVLMHYWKNMTYEEIAPQLGISPHMVKKYVSKALAHCRTRMGGLK